MVGAVIVISRRSSARDSLDSIPLFGLYSESGLFPAVAKLAASALTARHIIWCDVEADSRQIRRTSMNAATIRASLEEDGHGRQ